MTFLPTYVGRRITFDAGKSCLFRCDRRLFDERLPASPLYILLVEGESLRGAQLVGIGAVPLRRDVHREFCTEWIRLHNPRGDVVGSMELCVRLTEYAPIAYQALPSSTRLAPPQPLRAYSGHNSSKDKAPRNVQRKRAVASKRQSTKSPPTKILYAPPSHPIGRPYCCCGRSRFQAMRRLEQSNSQHAVVNSGCRVRRDKGEKSRRQAQSHARDRSKPPCVKSREVQVALSLPHEVESFSEGRGELVGVNNEASQSSGGHGGAVQHVSVDIPAREGKAVDDTEHMDGVEESGAEQREDAMPEHAAAEQGAPEDFPQGEQGDSGPPPNAAHDDNETYQRLSPVPSGKGGETEREGKIDDSPEQQEAVVTEEKEDIEQQYEKDFESEDDMLSASGSWD